MAQEGVVRAAGGVVSRRDEGGEVEVLLVHRPQPRGLVLPQGQSSRQARRTRSARSARCGRRPACAACLGSELPAVSYRDARGRAKTVRYWTMTADGDAEARNEIDAVRWLGIPAAANLLSYPGDRELLAAFAAR